MALLEVRDLDVQYATKAGTRYAASGVSFEVDRAEYLGIVGESGCGKTTVLKAITGILPANARIAGGSILFDGQDLTKLREREGRRIRWERVALVPQSAMNALDPVVSLRDQLVEAIRAHRRMSRHDAEARAAECFTLVGLDPARLRDYPHQFSGGMRQRAAIAMALVLDPDLIIGDEPTTGLDVIMQDQILGQLKSLQAELGRAMMLVTHNIAAVAENCERLAVMYAGQIFEYGDTDVVLRDPYNPYTLGLRNAFPSVQARDDLSLLSIPGSPPSLLDPGPGCRFADRCPFSTDLCRHEAPPLVEVASGHQSLCHYPDRVEEFRALATRAETWTQQHPRRHVAFRSAAPTDGAASSLAAEDLRTWFPVRQNLLDSVLRSRRQWVHAVDGVDLTLRPGQVLGLAGESGCGKTTTGMTLAHLVDATGGTVRFDGRDVLHGSRDDRRAFRRRVQVIFQDPYASLNPRFTVGRTVEEPLRVHRLGDHAERRRRVLDALELAELTPAEDYVDRFPHQLSGGQRQRAAIARATVLEPEFLIADEPVSMLDVSVRAGILTLLRRLVDELGIGLLYVTHDLSTMNHVCDEVAVMYLGRVVEHGPTAEVLGDPKHPYTRALVAAVPLPEPGARRQRSHLPGDVPSAVDPVPVCRFASRCPAVMAVCRENDPVLAPIGASTVACFLHHPPEGAVGAHPDEEDQMTRTATATRRAGG